MAVRYGCEGLMRLLMVLIWVSLMRGACAQNNSSWKTLSGKAPMVVARGGLSGVFPDQTEIAYGISSNYSFVDTLMFCDLQLTKDAKGICRTDIRLNNSTNIGDTFPDNKTTYLVNGKNTSGWFSIDFTQEFILNNVLAIQSSLYRPTVFDNSQTVLPLEGVPPLFEKQGIPVSIWLNVQYSKFYEEHNLSMPLYVRSLSRDFPVVYISSPEVGFLRDVSPRFRKSDVKLIFRFLDEQQIEPSTNETYGSLLRNLKLVKTFAAGILVPKRYIWPLDTELYLQASTTLVRDAHSAGLEIFAADFANDDFSMSYNYSFDPIREYLQYIDNDNFSVDGFLTDFSITATEAIVCYAHKNTSTSSTAGNPLIIAHNGDSGNYPGCTDIAYQNAIREGADYIDCSVQITKDGIPFCRESAYLLNGTTITSNPAFYPSRMTSIPAISAAEGIFTFDLTWEEIQSLTPNIDATFAIVGLSRNPAQANVGKYMNLTAFLEFAKNENISILISIENARTIASLRKLDVTNATLSALDKAGYDNISDRVRIQSDDNAVLLQFKQRTKFKLVYMVEKDKVTIPDSIIKEIKEFADTVALRRPVIFPLSLVTEYLSGISKVVQRMHLHNISVFVYPLTNEYSSLAIDYFSDPTLQINAYVDVAEVDGLVTEFPATAKAYLGNPCRQPQTPDDPYFYPVIPGTLAHFADLQPSPPYPALSGVVESPLPSINGKASSSAPSLAPSPALDKQPSSACQSRHYWFPSLLTVIFILFFNSC